jgi:hypothetical protein
MAYSAEISRNNPTCFLFLIDQSASMADVVTGQHSSKARFVADIVNRLLSNLVIRCSHAEGIRDYYHIGIIGYGNTVGPILAGPLIGKELVPISDIGENPARVEIRTKQEYDGAGGMLEKKFRMPVWFDPVAAGGTPMKQAFSKACDILHRWLSKRMDCFPPTVINITDGESTDGEPETEKIVSLASNDGHVLLLNIHVSSNPNARQLEFPNNSTILPDKFSKMLFDSSSVLTPRMVSMAQVEFGFNVNERSKAFVLNANPELIIKALKIGTEPSNLR